MGDNIDAALAARGYTGQPNCKFWEGHTDIGGPIKTDKIWFFVAYNHFKIDKQISGVPRNIATDLGVFDNYVDKGNLEGVAEGHRRRLLPVGPEAEAEPRPVGHRRSPEAAQPQDSVSWVYKGQHSRVWTNRLFTDVKVSLFGYDFPLGVSRRLPRAAAAPRHRHQLPERRGRRWRTAVRPAAGRSRRSTAQSTYYVPDRRAATISRSGFEYLLDDQRSTPSTARSGPIRYRDRNGRTTRSASPTSASIRGARHELDRLERSQPALFAATCRTAGTRTTDRHHAGVRWDTSVRAAWTAARSALSRTC